MKRIPSWQSVSQKRAIQLEFLYRGLEEGVVKATDELDRKKYSFDPSAHASLVRLYARDFYKRFPDVFQQVVDLNNVGMLLTSGEDKFRIFKSLKDGKPPLPGDSKELLKYYNQILVWQPSLVGLSTIVIDEPFNYIVHWSITSKGRFKEVKLACSKRATSYRAEWYFNEPIPNPSTRIAVPFQQEGTDDLDLDLIIRQLPLTGGDEPAG